MPADNSLIVHNKDILSKNIVFVDGIPRTGKALLSNLLLGFEKMSSIQFIPILENLMPLYITNKIKKDAISGFFSLFFNDNIYNYKLSRNVNFRYDDLTSIYNTCEPSLFLKNLSKKDGDTIIEELKEDNSYFQYQTHNIFAHYSKFLDLGIDIKLIELFRHPVDTVHSWYLRGWGTRFDEADPRAGTILFDFKDKIIPHYAVGNEEYYITLNPMEKCVLMHNSFLKKSIEEYKKLSPSQKNDILLLKYEDLIIHPLEQIEKIGNFLNLKTIPHMKKVMEDARVPRVVSSDERIKKLEHIRENVNKELYEELIHMASSYEENFYNLRP